MNAWEKCGYGDAYIMYREKEKYEKGDGIALFEML